jgi:flagellar biosynthetic protein FliR
VVIDLPTAFIMPFFLLLARVGGLMLLAPFFGSGSVAPIIKIAVSIGFCVTLFPSVEGMIPEVETEGSFIFTLCGEFAVGLLLGFIGRLFLASLEIAGQIMGFQMGFAMIRVVDPQTGVESPVMSILQNLIGILVFLSINGHHWFIQALVDSYRIVGEGVSPTGRLETHMVQAAGEMFILGMKIAAPIVVVLLIVDLLLGILGRAAPQIHILVVGLPAKVLMGFVFLAATIHTSIPFVGRHFSQLHRQLYTCLEVLGR